MGERHERMMQRRSGPGPGDRLFLAVVVILIVGTPTVFLRTAMRPFAIPQLTLLWVAAVVVLFLGAYRVVVSGLFGRASLPLTVASGTFAVALLLTSVVSSQPWVALTGLSARGAGALTYLLCLALLHAVYGLSRRRSGLHTLRWRGWPVGRRSEHPLSPWSTSTHSRVRWPPWLHWLYWCSGR